MKVKTQNGIEMRMCRLNEFGECDKMFQPTRSWMKFCCPDHRFRYWNLVKKEERKKMKRCGMKGCPNPRVDGDVFCEGHNTCVLVPLK